MSSSNCCFLTCIQISREVGKVVWYFHLLNNFPQFIVIYTVNGFGIVNKAEIDVFLELSYFVDDLVDVDNLISGSSAFSKTSLNIREFKDTYCWSLAWRILSITLLACEMSAIVWQFEHCLALPFFGIGMKTDLFQSCGHSWVFQICWKIRLKKISQLRQSHNWQWLCLYVSSLRSKGTMLSTSHSICLLKMNLRTASVFQTICEILVP